MSEVKEAFYFDQHNEDEFTLTQTSVQDVSSVIEENARQAERDNGFWDNRQGRKVASIPLVEVQNAIKAGYKLDTDDPVLLKIELYRYLREVGREQGYQTVKHIVTPGATPNIIIK